MDRSRCIERARRCSHPEARKTYPTPWSACMARQATCKTMLEGLLLACGHLHWLDILHRDVPPSEQEFRYSSSVVPSPETSTNQAPGDDDDDDDDDDRGSGDGGGGDDVVVATAADDDHDRKMRVKQHSSDSFPSTTSSSPSSSSSSSPLHPSAL